MTQANAVNRIMINVNGATEATVEMELLATIREFCKKSGVWRDTLVTTTVAGTTIYNLSPDSGAEITQVDQVYLGGYLINPLPQHGKPYAPDWPSFEYDRPNDRIILAYDPGDGLELLFYVWYRPVALANVPDLIWEDWEDAIISGTMASLYMQSSKPYTNPALAAVAHRRFITGIANARRRALSSDTRADAGWMYPNNGAQGRSWR